MKSHHFVTYCNFRKMCANLDFAKSLQTAPVEKYPLVPDTLSKKQTCTTFILQVKCFS